MEVILLSQDPINSKILLVFNYYGTNLVHKVYYEVVFLLIKTRNARKALGKTEILVRDAENSDFCFIWKFFVINYILEDKKKLNLKIKIKRVDLKMKKLEHLFISPH